LMLGRIVSTMMTAMRTFAQGMQADVHG